LSRSPASPKILRGFVALSLAAGLVLWLASLVSGDIASGVAAMWCFVVAAVVVAIFLPFRLALVSPLYVGALAWLVDMMPLVMLAGWAAVVLRWALQLWRERRWPAGGRWIWLPIGLTVWTALGVLVVPRYDFKHFILLLGIQGLITGIWLAAADRLTEREDRDAVIAGLLLYVVVMTGVVSLQWIGVPIQDLQNEEISEVAEEAYGVDAFPNSIGLIKYARSTSPGDDVLQRRVDRLRRQTPGMPKAQVFLPRLQAFENQLLVRFLGDARPHEDELRRLEITLIYDNVGLAPANSVPRLRSFARNALTYAGISAALLPLAFYLAWTGERRRRLIGRLAIAACLFGAALSLARGAWAAIAIGIAYLLVDGPVDRSRKRQIVVAFVVTAVVLTGFFLVRYKVDPMTGRAGGGASVSTRGNLYEETLDALKGVHIVLGFGTERPRTETGGVTEGVAGGKYVPRAGTHSTFLNYVFRTGVPGAIAIFVIYVIAWLHARAAAWQRRDEERLLATMLAMSVVILTAHAAILSLYVEPIYALTISLLIGMAMAIGRDLPGRIWPPKPRPQPRPEEQT
jgi:hypothetical protein